MEQVLLIGRRIHLGAHSGIARLMQLLVLVYGEISIGNATVQFDLAIGIVSAPHDLRIDERHHDNAVNDAKLLVTELFPVILSKRLGTPIAEAGNRMVVG